MPLLTLLSQIVFVLIHFNTIFYLFFNFRAVYTVFWIIPVLPPPNSSLPSATHTFQLHAFFFFLWPTESHLALPTCAWLWGICWSLKQPYQREAKLLKKSDSPSKSHQLTVGVSSARDGRHASLLHPCWVLDWLVLFRITYLMWVYECKEPGLQRLYRSSTPTSGSYSSQSAEQDLSSSQGRGIESFRISMGGVMCPLYFSGWVLANCWTMHHPSLLTAT